MKLADELIEIRYGAENWIDARVVGNIITEIRHRRGIDWRQPDRVDAEPIEIIEPRDNPAQIANAVPAGVLKRTRVDLVDDPPLPPLVLLAGIRRVHDDQACSNNQAKVFGGRSAIGRPQCANYFELLTFSAASTAAGKVGSAMPSAPRPSRRRSFTS